MTEDNETEEDSRFGNLEDEFEGLGGGPQQSPDPEPDSEESPDGGSGSNVAAASTERSDDSTDDEGGLALESRSETPTDATSGGEDERRNGRSSPTSDSPSESADDFDPKEPGFPFEAVVQEQIYPLDDEWNTWSIETQYAVDRLVHKHGLRKIKGREYQSALVAIANRHPQEVAEFIIEQRGVEFDESLAE